MWILLRKLKIFITPKILYNNNIDNNLVASENLLYIRGSEVRDYFFPRKARDNTCEGIV